VATTVSFLPGTGVGIVSASTFAVIDPVNRVLAERLWAVVGDTGSLDEILEILSGTGLRSLGSFALAQRDGSTLRVVVRGSGRALVATDSGTRHISASGVRTWVEESCESGSVLELSIGAADEEAWSLPPGPFSFRVAAGLVPATALRLTVDASLDLSQAPIPERATMVAAITVDEGVDVDNRPAPPAPDVVEQSSDDGRTRVVTDESLLEYRAERAGQVGVAASNPGMSAESSAAAQAEPDDYDAIYGRTVARSVQAAAVRVADEDEAAPTSPAPSPVPPGPASVAPPPSPLGTNDSPSGGLISGVPGSGDGRGSPAAPQSSALGDHDGRTMTAAQLAALRAGGARAATPPTPAPTPSGTMVQAMVCAAGHANPPQMAFCTRCGLRIEGTPSMVQRPPLGVLRFSNAAVVVLDRPALIGRNPKVEGSVAGEVPVIVKLDVGQGLSRTHAAVRLEGWSALLDDLNSANGTVVTLPGREPRRLHPGEPVLLEPGAEIDFGGEISCRMDAE
jgi:hypothetical protein